jgi:hypothetical protein
MKRRMEGEAVHLASALLHVGMGLGIIGRNNKGRGNGRREAQLSLMLFVNGFPLSSTQ